MASAYTESVGRTEVLKPTQARRDIYDVIIVGGGNAAICAAIAAGQGGARVLLLERAPQHMRGGNTRHTRNIRCAHAAADDFFSGPYPEEEYLEDLIAVTGGPANLDLAKFTIRETSKLPQWMSAHGARWQKPLAGTLHLGRTNRWFLGGGKTLLNAYYRTAERIGVEFRYDAPVEDLIIENNQFEAAIVKNGEKQQLIRGKAVVIAAGGFEANFEWLKKSWGEAADNFIVRGTPYNDGKTLAILLAKGAQSIGDPKAIHAIAVDARAPKYDGGIVIRLDSVPFGVVVNQLGRRFYDEGEEIWPKRYAIWGGLIVSQPGQIAYSIIDSKMIDAFLPPLYKPYQSDSLEGLGQALGIDVAAFLQTMKEYNSGTAGNTTVRMQVLDGVGTKNVSPPKTNWALPIDRPPFYALPLRAGITFTYMGLAVDERARVLDTRGRAFENVYAAGEVMSGNILTKGYVGGIGLAIGAIFGRLAGRDAIINVRK
ncbi:MAG: FAD-dependent tricarballylate dehydrogenase TcuA [Candidatus Acidiferrales bacterium]